MPLFGCSTKYSGIVLKVQLKLKLVNSILFLLKTSKNHSFVTNLMGVEIIVIQFILLNCLFRILGQILKKFLYLPANIARITNKQNKSPSGVLLHRCSKKIIKTKENTTNGKINSTDLLRGDLHRIFLLQKKNGC